MIGGRAHFAQLDNASRKLIANPPAPPTRRITTYTTSGTHPTRKVFEEHERPYLLDTLAVRRIVAAGAVLIFAGGWVALARAHRLIHGVMTAPSFPHPAMAEATRIPSVRAVLGCMSCPTPIPTAPTAMAPTRTCRLCVYDFQANSLAPLNIQASRQHRCGLRRLAWGPSLLT